MPGADLNAVKGMVDMMNDPFINDPNFDITKQPRRSVAPPSEVSPPTPPSVDIAAPTTAQIMAANPNPSTQEVLNRVSLFKGRKIAYTGRLAAGKDYVAARTGATLLGFADPMYAVASYFFGVEVTATQNKDLPGMRQFLQILGQWGKNIINEQYPLTPARACFVTMMRSLGAMAKFEGFEVNWDDYGKSNSLWTDALVRRAEKIEAAGTADTKLGVTNVRFQVEYDALVKTGGWTHFHIMCSPQTWAKRLASKKLTPQSKELNDISEQMTIAMDKSVMDALRKPGGAKIRCVWNDDEVKPPSPRLFTVAEFLNELEFSIKPALCDPPLPSVNMALE